MDEELTRLARGRRILVVEDEYLIAADLGEALEECGALVVGPVPSVSAALRCIAEETALDGATLDVTLGQEKSYPVAEALRARGLPFVFLTGYGDRSLPDAFRDAPRCDKPFDLRALLRALFG